MFCVTNIYKPRKIVVILSMTGLLFVLNSASAQLSLPINHLITQKVESAAIYQNPIFFTCVKPFNEIQLRTFANVDSVLAFDSKPRVTWFGRKIWKESFLQIDSSEFKLTFDPLVNLQIGKDIESGKRTMVNTRGARVRGLIGKNVGFETSFYENQGIFAPFWDDYIRRYEISPGQGRAKHFGTAGWDYAFSSGYVQWQASKVVNVQFGHDKIFVGDGYRSLLLSDASTNYPFMRFTFTWKRVQYTRIVASLMNIDYKAIRKDTIAFPKKTANFHILSFSLPKRVQLTLFEGIIIGNPDLRGRFKLNMGVLSPIPFVDMLKNNQLQTNSVAGTNIRWQIAKGLAAYNQWVIDYDKIDKLKNFGYQVGIKYYNALNINRLFLQTEYNVVVPYTYANSDSVIAYSHYSQPLAHPLGANFKEFVGVCNYQFGHWSVYGKITLAKYGTGDSTTNWGKDVMKPKPAITSTSRLLQGEVTNLTTFEGALSFYFNPKNQMNISAGFYLQDTDAAKFQKITVIYLAFRTSLSNLYYDFR